LQENIISQKDLLTNIESKIQNESNFLNACIQKLLKNEKIPDVSNQIELFKDLYKSIQLLEERNNDFKNKEKNNEEKNNKEDKKDEIKEKKNEEIKKEIINNKIEEISSDGPPYNIFIKNL
jgi:hypothetical protein